MQKFNNSYFITVFALFVFVVCLLFVFVFAVCSYCSALELCLIDLRWNCSIDLLDCLETQKDVLSTIR